MYHPLHKPQPGNQPRVAVTFLWSPRPAGLQRLLVFREGTQKGSWAVGPMGKAAWVVHSTTWYLVCFQYMSGFCNTWDHLCS